MIYFPAVLLLYFLVPKIWDRGTGTDVKPATKTFRWVMLLAASYYFYLSWNWKLVYLIMFTTAVSYMSSIIIAGRAPLKLKIPCLVFIPLICASFIAGYSVLAPVFGFELNGQLIALTLATALVSVFYGIVIGKKNTEKPCLVVTLVVCLGILAVYKYFNFLSNSVTDVINACGGKADKFVLNLILPVGISFYTFQTLSYVIDVYRGTTQIETHFGYYALYVSFFPQLVAGPIERPENLLPQLRAQHCLEWKNVYAGLRKMLIGFFKKVVVADLLATYVVSVYGKVDSANGFTVLLATVLFSFQIYCDFSGYTDIAIGCAEVMGIRLMQNFDRPYIAKSIKEFWARWHISLSSWFKDYIYIPLGGNRVSKFRNCLNILIVFLVSGLWHGAEWTFVIWGALHGLYQIIGKFTFKPRNKLWQKLKINPDGLFVSSLRTFNTFLFAAFAWILFRADNFADAKVLIAKLFTDWQFNAEFFTGSLDGMGLTLVGIITTVLSLFILSRLDKTKLEPAESHSLLDVRCGYIIWAIALAWVILLAGDGASSFIYFQF